MPLENRCQSPSKPGLENKFSLNRAGKKADGGKAMPENRVIQPERGGVRPTSVSNRTLGPNERLGRAPAHGKHDEQKSAVAGLAKTVISRLLPGVACVFRHDERAIEEHVLAFFR